MTRDGAYARRARIERAFTNTYGFGPANSVCLACTELVRVGGSSVMVMVGEVSSMLCASDPVAARLEDLQQTLGEGPCRDAQRSGKAVLAPDLAAAGRWAGFAAEAVAAGAAALFSFPMRIGGVTLGALSIYSPRPGGLTDAQYLDARAMAHVAGIAVLSLQARIGGEDLSPELEVLASDRAEVHQAAGMVSVQLGVGVGEAMVRLRAHAYAASRPLAEVAADVVARRLRLGE